MKSHVVRSLTRTGMTSSWVTRSRIELVPVPVSGELCFQNAQHVFEFGDHLLNKKLELCLIFLGIRAC